MHEAASVNRRNGTPAALAGRDRGPDAARQCWSSNEFPVSLRASRRQGRAQSRHLSILPLHDTKETMDIFTIDVGPLSVAIQVNALKKGRIGCYPSP